jgi:hypothetical protein
MPVTVDDHPEQARGRRSKPGPAPEPVEVVLPDHPPMLNPAAAKILLKILLQNNDRSGEQAA